MTSLKGWSESKINYIVRSVIEVANHLSANDILKDNVVKERLKNANTQLCVLLIGDKAVIDIIENMLILHCNDLLTQHSSRSINNYTNDSDYPANNIGLLCTDLNIDSMSVSEFVTSRFNNRYDLGCFINPSIFNYDSLSQQQLSLITIRLRDLFARQSLVFTEPSESIHSIYPSLGYTITSFDKSESEIDCWQFNIINYKTIPDWLNARYWANPDNFNKYRW